MNEKHKKNFSLYIVKNHKGEKIEKIILNTSRLTAKYTLPDQIEETYSKE